MFDIRKENRIYTPNNWYWIVNKDESKVFSSKVKDYVSLTDTNYIKWKEKNIVPTYINSEMELLDVLRIQAPQCLPSWV